MGFSHVTKMVNAVLFQENVLLVHLMFKKKNPLLLTVIDFLFKLGFG